MKILLVYPHCLEERLHDEDASVAPIGLYYVGAAAKAAGHDVQLLNTHPLRGRPDLIRKFISEGSWDVMGFSILHANRWPGIEMARMAKGVHPDMRLVFGGIGTTFLWSHFMHHFPEIDYAVVGEGELAFLGLLSCIQQGDREGLRRVKGIAFREQGQVIFTGAADVVRDLDQLPDPSRYFDFQHLTSTRGCPGNCTFCGSPGFWGHKVRFHSPAYFVDQLEKLYRRGKRFFYFSDDTFTIKPERAIAICQDMISRELDVSWAAICRIKDIREDLLYWMRKAGCVQISYGVESGAPEIRALLGKKIDDDEIKTAFRLTQSYGMMARAYFIYGCPGECDETIQATLDLIEAIQPLSAIFYILDLFPGTALWRDYVKRSGVTDDVWLERVEDIMYFEVSEGLTTERILSYGERLRREFYRRLGDYAMSLDLVDLPELYPLHADFLSRLGMTFSHGDYAQIDEVPGKAEVSEHLFRRALGYSPDQRAYLGLGILLQKRGAHAEAIRVMTDAVNIFPGSEALRMCKAISLMNMGDYARALALFLEFPESLQALQQAAMCYKVMGDEAKEAEMLRRLEETRSRVGGQNS